MACLTPLLPARAETPKQDSLQEYNARMAWFADAQYGMFIHFGLYSILGGEWKGEAAEGYSEWIQSRLGIPREEYAELIKQFHPTEFDADFLARTAKESGMTYLVITAKHHEGFCLWDSKFTDFDVAGSPFKGRDILAELKAACDKYGLKFGIYYSIIDWNHPAQEPDLKAREGRFSWKHAELVEGQDQTYFDYQTNQVLELIKKYDPALLWFDADWADWWNLEEGIKLYHAIRKASPDIIVNNRVAKRSLIEFDYVTREQNHFEDVFPRHWEGCYTMNKSWGYKKNDHEWKDAATIYAKLKDINEKGGNLLLNVGPDGRGVVQPEALQILRETATLLKEKPITKSKPQITQVPGIVESSARVAWQDLVPNRVQENPEFRFIEHNPTLPNVFLYGDSISMGYTEEVRRQLDGAANVYRLHDNGGTSGSFIPKMKDLNTAMRDPLLDKPWDFDWDVIHFNAGIHDLTYRREADGERDKIEGKLTTTIPQYKQNLEEIIAYLRKMAPNAKLIFATTTPIPEDEPGRIADDAVKYNKAALEVLSRHPDIAINDLHAFTKPNHSKWWRKPGDVHYNEAGSIAHGTQVAEVIRPALPRFKTIQLEGETIRVTPKAVEPTLTDIAYGPHERNKLDFWKAESSKPTPLVLYIHGGGWVSGSKEENKGPFLGLLDDGVSYVSINYRLARGSDTLPASLHDAARALQFVRSKAKEWNIDPERIIVSGGSAGGCSSLWLAYHDDLADPESDDPVSRQSTRVLGAAVLKAQSTIDPWIVDKRLGPTASGHRMIWQTVGAPSLQALFEDWDKYKAISIESSPLTHMTPDDPPVFAVYDADTPAPPERDGIHHAEFGRILKEKGDALGLACTISFHGKDDREAALDAFMLERFQAAAR
jgi:alpha-L-fucosidase